MEAGKLNRRITLQKRIQQQDASGQPVDIWEDVAKVWAWPKTQTGMGVTRNAGDVAASLNSYSFRVRYRPSITEDMRILHDGFVFAIHQVQHDIEGRVWTDLVCRTGAANA